MVPSGSQIQAQVQTATCLEQSLTLPGGEALALPEQEWVQGLALAWGWAWGSEWAEEQGSVEEEALPVSSREHSVT